MKTPSPSRLDLDGKAQKNFEDAARLVDDLALNSNTTPEDVLARYQNIALSDPTGSYRFDLLGQLCEDDRVDVKWVELICQNDRELFAQSSKKDLGVFLEPIEKRREKNDAAHRPGLVYKNLVVLTSWGSAKPDLFWFQGEHPKPLRGLVDDLAITSDDVPVDIVKRFFALLLNSQETFAVSELNDFFKSVLPYALVKLDDIDWIGPLKLSADQFFLTTEVEGVTGKALRLSFEFVHLLPFHLMMQGVDIIEREGLSKNSKKWSMWPQKLLDHSPDLADALFLHTINQQKKFDTRNKDFFVDDLGSQPFAYALNQACCNHLSAKVSELVIKHCQEQNLNPPPLLLARMSKEAIEKELAQDDGFLGFLKDKQASRPTKM